MLKTEQGVQSLAIVLLSLLGAVLLSEASRSPNIVLVSTFSVSQASISNSAMSNDLAAFLRDSKRDFLAALQDEHKQEWVLVMGNESGDLDSAASAIAFAYLSSQLSGRHKRYAVLYRSNVEDLVLRKENQLAFDEAGISESDIMFLDDLAALDLSNLGVSIALVDHNKLSAEFGGRDEAVVAIIDHHEDEKHHLSASPRLIQVPTGSCSSLVTLHFFQQLPLDKFPIQLARLIISAQLVDTANFKLTKGKATPQDFEALSYLSQVLSLSSSLAASDPSSLFQDKFNQLKEAKYAISHLSSRDLLRRDYKQYSSENGYRYGLSSVPMAFDDWSERDGWEGIMAASQAWAEERSLDIVGILTSYTRTTKKNNQKGRREAFLYYSRSDLMSVSNTLEKDFREQLDLVAWKSEKAHPDLEYKENRNFSLWTQGNADATRKAFAPAMANAVSRLEQNTA